MVGVDVSHPTVTFRVHLLRRLLLNKRLGAVCREEASRRLSSTGQRNMFLFNHSLTTSGRSPNLLLLFRKLCRKTSVLQGDFDYAEVLNVISVLRDWERESTSALRTLTRTVDDIRNAAMKATGRNIEVRGT